MKCNKCKKIIPQGEELSSSWTNYRGWYHEECAKKLEEENKNFLFKLLIIIIATFIFFISLALLLKNK
jgi:hypothetical protein